MNRIDRLDLLIIEARRQMENRRTMQPRPPIRRRRQAGETLNEGARPRKVPPRARSAGNPKNHKRKRGRSCTLPSWWKQVFGPKNTRLVQEHQRRDTSDSDSEEEKNLNQEDEDESPPHGWMCDADHPECVILCPGLIGPGDAVIRRKNIKDMQRLRREKERNLDTSKFFMTNPDIPTAQDVSNHPTMYPRSCEYTRPHSIPAPILTDISASGNPPVLTPYKCNPRTPILKPSTTLPDLTPHITSSKQRLCTPQFTPLIPSQQMPPPQASLHRRIPPPPKSPHILLPSFPRRSPRLSKKRPRYY